MPRPDFDNLQSLGHCRNQCGGYAFAITQGTSCWCSNYAPSSTVDNGSCDMKCPGYPYEVCGSEGGAYSYLQLGEPQGTGGPGAVRPQPSAAPSQPAYTPDPQTIYQTVENTVVSSNVVVQTTAIVQTSVVRSLRSLRLRHERVARLQLLTPRLVCPTSFYCRARYRHPGPDFARRGTYMLKLSLPYDMRRMP